MAGAAPGDIAVMFPGKCYIATLLHLVTLQRGITLVTGAALFKAGAVLSDLAASHFEAGFVELHFRCAGQFLNEFSQNWFSQLLSSIAGT